MTSREAIHRLSVNVSDCLAVSWLHHNHAEVIHALVTRCFGIGPVADKAECELMQRVAEQTRSYERQENPDQWLVRCATTECDRLRNEAIHDQANSAGIRNGKP
jgi:hypothetical protein